MDKPSDRVYRPFAFVEDEAEIAADWAREHPQEAEMIAKYRGAEEDESVASERWERAMAAKRDLLGREGFPVTAWDETERDSAVSQTHAAEDVERDAYRRRMRGGLPDSSEEMPAQATEGGGKPFRLGR